MPTLAELTSETDEFIRTEVLPIDDEHDGDVEAAGGEDLRTRLQSKARERGLLTPHGPVEFGGHGLNMSDRAPVFEAAGYSLFGPMATNINAPDEGNLHLLAQVGTSAQKERYLRPLAEGQHRSAFAMTEPRPARARIRARCSPAHRGWTVGG